MQKNIIRKNNPVLGSPIREYYSVEVLDKHNGFFWAVMFALLIQPELYSGTSFYASNKDQSFKTICKMWFDELSFGEEKKIKNLIEKLKRDEDLTFIIRNIVFQRAIFSLRKKIEGYIKENGPIFSKLFPFYHETLKSFSISGRHPSECDIKATALWFDHQIMITNTQTQEKKRYSVNSSTLTIQKPFSYVNKAPIYLQYDGEYYYFGRINPPVLMKWIAASRALLPSCPYRAYSLKNSLAYRQHTWRETKKRVALSGQTKNNLLKKNANLISKKHYTDIFFYTPRMIWLSCDFILLASCSIFRILFAQEQELDTLSFNNMIHQNAKDYQLEYQNFLMKKTSFDQLLEYIIPPGNPFRIGLISGLFLDVSRYSARKKQIYLLVLFVSMILGIGLRSKIHDDPFFCYIETLLPISFILFSGIAHFPWQERVENFLVMIFMYSMFVPDITKTPFAALIKTFFSIALMCSFFTPEVNTQICSFSEKTSKFINNTMQKIKQQSKISYFFNSETSDEALKASQIDTATIQRLSQNDEVNQEAEAAMTFSPQHGKSAIPALIAR